MLAPDGKTWSDGRYYSNNHGPGQLNQLRQAYIWNLSATKVVCGYYDYAGMPVPHNDCGIYDTVPVLTAEGPDLVEDSRQVYREACRDKQYPQAIGLQFLSSPDQLRRPGLVKTMACFDNLAEFRKWFSEQSLGARFLDWPALWVTSGPEIVAWQRLGSRDYIHRNPNEFVWQNALNKFRIKVRSDVELKSVEVWDDDQLFRRFQPSGNEFETVFWLDNRDQQRELILEVTDADGRRAVGGRLLTKNQLLQQVNCGDRNNQLAGWLVRRRSDGSVLGGSGLPATPDKRVDQMSTLPSSVFKQDVKLGTGAFDGVPRYVGYPAVQEALLLHVDGAFGRFSDDRQVSQTRWSSEENGSHQIAVSAFSNMDVLIGDRIVEDVFDDKIDVIHVWNTLWRIKPRQYSTWTERRFVLRPRGDQPLAMNIWQYHVKLKKDVAYGGQDPLGVDAVRMSPGGCRYWSLGPAGPSAVPVARGSFGEREDEVPAGRAPRVSDFGVGAWAAYTGSPGGGEIVFSLTPNLRIACPTGSPARPRFSIGLSPENSPHKKGEEAELRLLVVGVPRYGKGCSDRVAVADPVEVAKAIKTGLGVGCPPSYRAGWQRGTPLPGDYVCRVRAENGAVVGHFDQVADLIAPIPVWVEGLSPNWTTFYCERDKDRQRPVGQFEGTCRVLVDPSYGDVDLFVGHPITADSRELRIHVVQIGESAWSVELHNPTSEPIATRLSSDPDWPLFGKPFQRDVTVAPGCSLSCQVEGVSKGTTRGLSQFSRSENGTVPFQNP